MARTEMANVHDMGDLLVEPFILLENTGSWETERFAEARCMWWKFGSHKSGLENISVLYFKITLFQFQYKM